MFSVNAALFLFQMISLCVWYWKFYWYTSNFYGHNCADATSWDGWFLEQCGGLVGSVDALSCD